MIMQIVNMFGNKLGFEIRSYFPGNSYWASLEKLLVHNNIDLVLDIGANTGQFASSLRKSGYRGRIVSFEPLQNAYKQLAHKAASDPLWIVAPRMAVGNMDGEISLNIAANSVSSSIANMLDAHLDAAPESHYVGTERVPINRLDTLAKTYVPATARTFLKIDTQGYEQQVLEGGEKLLKSVRGLQLELSLVPLYEGGGLFLEIVQEMKNLGFDLYGLFDAFTDKRTGRMLQVDGIFFRPQEP